MYIDDKEVASDKPLKLYVDARKISCKDVSLVTVRYITQNTLNLVEAKKNKVAEMKMNLENIRILDMIHFHKKN